VLFQPRDALAQHAWESEILAYEAQDRTNPPPLGSVVVTGSSTIQRWSTIRTDLAPLDIIPRGFGGSTTDDLDYYLERVVLVYQPRAVVIYEGDNDIANGRPAQYVADRVAGILARISARLPAARVYVLSIKPSPGRWFQWTTQSAANQLLAAICAADARYTFINTAPAMLGSNGQPKPEYYVADGLHLSAAGYQAVTNVVRPVLLPQQLIPLPVDTVPPTTPTGVTATTQSKSRIDLRWNAAGDTGSGLAGYSVFRNGLRVGTTTTLGYSDTGLTSNTLYTYTITAFDRMSPNRNESAQSASASATTLVDPTLPPTVSLQASPSSVAIGSSAQLSWSSTNASSCMASGGWSGAKGTSGTAASANLFANATFTLTCTGTGGTASDSKSVNVIPAPTVSLTASPSSIASGSATQLSWSSTNANSCTASGSWSGAKATSGTATSSKMSSNATFTLTCTGSGGDATSSAAVTVIVPPPPTPPTVSLSADPKTTIAYGGVAQLSWASTNATACSASGGWSGSRAQSGAESTPALTSGTTFALTCSGPGGEASGSVNIAVAAPPPPTATLTATPANVDFNAATQLSWSSSNATSCTASRGWSGSRGLSGSESSPSLTESTVFELVCSGPGGTVSSSAQVSVTPPPVPSVTLSATPGTVTNGSTARLSWSTKDANDCAASGAWTGQKGPAGDEQTTALATESTFSLSCAGPGGSAYATITIKVTAAPGFTEAPTPTVTATSGGGGGTLSWWEVSGLLMLLIRRLRLTRAPSSRRVFTSADREVVDTVLAQ
jgi:lysophospholipase L1-like esterase